MYVTTGYTPGEGITIVMTAKVYARAVEGQPITWSFSDEHTTIGLALGYRVQFDLPGWIVQASWLQSADDTDAHAAYLLDSEANLLHVACWLPSPTAGGEGGFTWVRRNIKPAWRVESGRTYEWIVWFPHPRYGYSPGQLSSALSSGPITIPANNFDGASSAGLFDYNTAFQTDFARGEATLYAVDFAFQP